MQPSICERREFGITDAIESWRNPLNKGYRLNEDSYLGKINIPIADNTTGMDTW
jgi:hypothetical protein